MGVKSYSEAVKATEGWSVPVEQITCSVLSMVGEGEDDTFKQQAEQFRQRIQSPITVHHFSKASGADAHSQANNFPQAHQVLYDWFDTILK